MILSVLAGSATHGQHRRALAQAIEFIAIGMIGNHQFGIRAAQPVIDRIGPKRGKERLIDRTNPPSGEHGHQQRCRARQHAGNSVPLPQPLAFQPPCQMPTLLLQFGIGQRMGLALGIFMHQRQHITTALAYVPSTASLVGIQAPIVVVIQLGDDAIY